MEARKVDFTATVNERIYVSEESEQHRLKELKRKKVEGGLTFFKVVSILVLLIVFGYASVMLKGYAGISALQVEVSGLEKTKKQLLSQKADLIAELEGLKASLKIQEEAKYKLGMVYPTVDQIVYLTVEDVKNNEETTDSVSLLDEIRKIFRNE